MFDVFSRGFTVPYFDTGIDSKVEVSPHLDFPESALLPWLKVEDEEGHKNVGLGTFGLMAKHKIDPNSHNFNRLLDPVGLLLLIFDTAV